MDRETHALEAHAAPDLFGEIPVTLDDVLAYMLAVPGIPPDSPRFAYYARGWNVIEKIRREKAAGTFEATITNCLRPPTSARLAAALEAGRAFRRAPPIG